MYYSCTCKLQYMYIHIYDYYQWKKRKIITNQRTIFLGYGKIHPLTNDGYVNMYKTF
jgi:hypothetical protein